MPLPAARTQARAQQITGGIAARLLWSVTVRARSEALAVLRRLGQTILGIGVEARSRGAWTYQGMLGPLSPWRQAVQEAIRTAVTEIRLITERAEAVARDLGWLLTLWSVDVSTPPTTPVRIAAPVNRMTLPTNGVNGMTPRDDDRWAEMAARLDRDLSGILARATLNQREVAAVADAVRGYLGVREVPYPARIGRARLEEQETPDWQRRPTRGPVTGIGFTTPLRPQIMDRARWNLAVQALRDQMEWQTRRPGVLDADGRAAWVVERDLVSRVAAGISAGTIEATFENQETVEDLIWVSVIDAANEREDAGPDERNCRLRDGMTLSEIRARWGEPAAPPLHVACRCSVIPQVREWQDLAAEIRDADAAGDERRLVTPAGVAETVDLPDVMEWIRLVEP